MRILKLSFEAVGSFGGKETIDFTKLGTGSGVFLIHGPTGSGKSTILDAIVFALYNDVALESNSSKSRLRSDYAGDDQISWVQLDFEARGQLYRVWRTPKYVRPKRRGSGTTSQAAEASLWRLNSEDADPGDAIASQPRTVNEELVTRILPLTKSQFLQTVILPQGAFSRFLRASSDERQEILQQIFGTQIYERMQNEFIERARTAQASAQTESQMLSSQLKLFIENWSNLANSVAGSRTEIETLRAIQTSLPTVLDEDLIKSWEPYYHLPTAQAHEWITEYTQQVKATAKRYQIALENKEKAKALTHDFQELTRLLAVEKQLLASQEKIQNAREQMLLHERAQRVNVELTAQQHYQENLHAAQAKLTEKLQVSPAPFATWKLPQDGISLADLEEKITRQQRKNDKDLGALTPLIERQKKLDLLKKHAQKSRQKYIEHSRAAAQEAKKFVLLVPEIKTLLRRQMHLEKGQLCFESAQQKQLQLRQYQGERQHFLQDFKRFQAQVAKLPILKKEVARTRAAVSAYEREFFVDSSILLASHLEPDSPCPVCGSSSHPHPALGTVSGEHSLSQLTQLRNQLTRAKTSLMKTQEQVISERNRLLGEIKQLRAKCPGNAQAIDRNVAYLQKQAEELKKLQKQLIERKKQAQKYRDSIQNSTNAAKLEKNSVNMTLEQIREITTEIAASGQSSDLGARQQSLKREQGKLSSLFKALQEVKDAHSNLAQARARFEQSLREEQFPDPPTAQAALLEDQKFQELKREVQTWDDEYKTNQVKLNSDRIQRVRQQEFVLPDLEILESKVREEAKILQKYQEELAKVKEQLKTVEITVSDLQTDTARYLESICDTSLLITFANLAKGEEGSALKAPLATWVLLDRFEEVLNAANPYLMGISGGRYQLSHTDSESSRRRNQALSLAVTDNFSDKAREISALSGGELFYCSLSLALGLSEVVTAEAGGVEISSMFIDEGFGTLDDTKRTQVMQALKKTSASGRSVGLISHVVSLRSEISDQIEVIASKGRGSTLKITGN
ncbi:SbcC/MukB-like Walker B domain-containing protein [Varibaculum vaginae]|uniref:SbcC/MukB-like Walker B domain-containing protein n=1 Tax=Varibaculum vaginae TaxID=2364797 RepID=UPI000F084DE3|nr:SMC family ATPase [Varibaculum vaginae]